MDTINSEPFDKKMLKRLASQSTMLGVHVNTKHPYDTEKVEEEVLRRQSSLRRKAGIIDPTGSSFGGSGTVPRTPLLYLDPLFDPVLMMFPKDNITELNRRLRHYYIYNPIIRNIINLHCVVKGTSVFTDKGSTNIEDVVKGDMVLSSTGKYQEVKWSGPTHWDGNLVDLAMWYFEPVSMTDNHFVKIKRGIYKTETKQYKTNKAPVKWWDLDTNFIWVMAKEIKPNDFLVVPKFKIEKEYTEIDLTDYIGDSNQSLSAYTVTEEEIITCRGRKYKRFISINEEFAELLGWYVAEGCAEIQPNSGSGRVCISLNRYDEQDIADRLMFLIEKIFGLNSIKVEDPDSGKMVIVLNSNIVSRFFLEYAGDGAHNKYIHECILHNNKNILKSFLKAYLQGDGTLKSNEHQISCDTVSVNLANQLVMAGTKVGLLFSLHKTSKTLKITGKTYKGFVLKASRDKANEFIWDKNLSPDYIKSKKNHSFYFEDEDNFYIKVKSVNTRKFVGDVYDIKTEDGTFSTPVVVSNSSFPLSDFNLQCEDSQVSEYFNDYKDRKNLLEYFIMLATDYWLLGEAFGFGNFNIGDMEFSDFVQFPPEDVEIHKIYALPESIYYLRANETLKGTLNSNKRVDKAQLEMLQELNPELATKIRKGLKYRLNNDKLIHLSMRPNKYTLRGISPVLAAVKDLLAEDKLRLLQYTQIDRQYSPIKHWKLGSKEKGWIPPKKAFTEFQQLLMSSSNDPDFSMITHPFVENAWVTPVGQNKELIPDFEYVTKRLMIALFVNDAVLSGELGPYASQAVSIKVLMNKYLTFRSVLANQAINKIFYPISVARGFKKRSEADLQHNVRTGKGFRGYITPKMFWEKLNLANNSSVQEMVLRLRERGDLPMKNVAEMFDWNTEDLKRNFLEEEATSLDPVWRKARESKSQEPEISNQLLKGKKTTAWDFTNTEDKQEEGGAETPSFEEPAGAGAGAGELPPMGIPQGNPGGEVTPPAEEGELTPEVEEPQEPVGGEEI